MKKTPAYRKELANLQRELVLLQQTVEKQGRRLMIIFEGRDAAGKGGAIRRFARHLNHRSMEIVALPKPTNREMGQWFFQRYLQHLPNKGEIVFFDRSWYNRAVVEPVMGFCDKQQYTTFMKQLPLVEEMLIDDGIEIIKFWFSINKRAQKTRFGGRRSDILKQWKLSTVDALAQEKWDDFTHYKERMFEGTHSEKSPWIIIDGNDKQIARLEAIRHVLNTCDYERKGECGESLTPNPEIVTPYHKTKIYRRWRKNEKGR